MKSLILSLALTLIPASTYAWGDDVHVDGYLRKDGTYVQPHYRTAPDDNPYNNYSYPGNTNPYNSKQNRDTFSNNWNTQSPSSNIGGINSLGNQNRW